jgi:cob(I)alamin adenosyltransferase
MDDSSLPRIYTRTGDGGETGLFDGTRVSKADPRVDACGDVDELSAWLGLAHVTLASSDLGTLLESLQRDLFAIGAQLADPGHRIASRVEKSRIDAARVQALEASIDLLEAPLAPLRRFVLPGGSQAGALLHLARAVCRRVERRVVGLGGIDRPVLIYLNRLSDLLFVMARAANARAGVSEIEW